MVRRGALAALIVAFVIGAIYLWRSGTVTPSSVREWLDSLGAIAPLLFIVVFVLGSFVGLPGMAFVVGGVLAFGPLLGMGLGYVAGMTAVTAPFTLARTMRARGQPWRPTNRWLARAYAMLERHPFRAVVTLRLILWFNPPLSYALAFSPVSSRTYVVGCAVALAPVVALATAITQWASGPL